MKRSDAKAILTQTKHRLIASMHCNKMLTSREIILLATDHLSNAGLKQNIHFIKYTPRSLFKRWAQDYLEQNFQYLNAQTSFSDLHRHVYRSFRKFWRTNDGGSPLPNQLNLFVDSLIKHLSSWENLKPERKDWFYSNCHVPLDNSTLTFIRRYGSSLKKVPLYDEVYKATNAKGYRSLQGKLKIICHPYPSLTGDLLFRKKQGELTFFSLKKIKS